MTRLRYSLLLAALAILPTHATEVDVIEEAQSKTVYWLSLVDGKRFESSWDSAASLFQEAVTKTGWSQAISGVRAPLGAIRSRELSSSEFTTSLPGAPDGEFVVFQFEATFENKAEAVETVTAMRDTDGEWKVAGYFIR
jgi:hypothetical protein